jgi:hypothetical protein
MEIVRSYIERGRCHAGQTDEVLAVLYVDAMRRWASDPSSIQRRVDSDDVVAEYQLRSREAPISLVMEDVMHLVEIFMLQLERANDPSFSELEEMMMEEYLDIHEPAS